MSTLQTPNPDPLVPRDPRVQHLATRILSYEYAYMLATPSSPPVATVLLLHGFPDLGMAWRYQVPYLLSLNLRVIVPDMLGYGQTSAPADFGEYTLKKISHHMALLVEKVVGKNQKIVVGGHDWGAALAWRIPMWYPELVLGVFGLNVPFMPPAPSFTEMEQLVKRLPSLSYQIQFASPVAEQMVGDSSDRLRRFINGIYGGTTPDGGHALSAAEGLIEANLTNVGNATLMSQEMVDYYVQEFSRNGVHAPFNWYRTRKLNHEDEKQLLKDGAPYRYQTPAMVVMAEKDIALPPSMADGSEQWFANGLKKSVVEGAGHWAMWQEPAKINQLIGEFITDLLQ